MRESQSGSGHNERFFIQREASLQKKPVNRWILLLRVGVAISLITVLFVYFGFAEILARLTSLDPMLASLALVILTIQFLMSCGRWHYIVRRLGLPLTLGRSFSIYGIGALANLVMLLAIAGLSVRGILLLRDGITASNTAVTLLTERLAAVGGMGLCVALGLVFSHELLIPLFNRFDNTETIVLITIVGTLSVGGLAAMAWRFEPVRRFVAQFRNSVLSIPVLGILILYSAVIVLLGFVGVAILAHSMDIDIDPLFFVAVMPVVALIAALPISIGGWGVREGMMVAGLALFGVPADAALALSVLYGIVGVLVVCSLGAIAILVFALKQRGRTRFTPSRDSN